MQDVSRLIFSKIMFKFSIPMTIILSSSSCLTLLAIGSLLLMSNTVQTSDIQTTADTRTNADGLTINRNSTPISFTSESSDDKFENTQQDSRRRSGRLYNPVGYGGTSQAQQQSAFDSYAAAYAAANTPSSSDQGSSNHLVQSSIQANDANAYNSFGESPSSGSSGSTTVTGSTGRQLSATEYAPYSNHYASYMSPSSNEASYSNQQQHHYPSANHYRTQPALSSSYPSNTYDRHSNYHDRYGYYHGAAEAPLWSTSSHSGGLMSSASSMLSHWTNGFSISEIICGLIAISIGAIILGAPFFLIYLALMGNFSGSSTLSLTNPTQGTTPAGGANTTNNGRRKRLAVFEQSPSFNDDNKTSEYIVLADSIMSQLSPFVDLQQVVRTFKRLTDSIEKYSNMKAENVTNGKRKSF